MCGIAGVIRFSREPIPPQRLAAACSIMRYRGPDHAGSCVIQGDEGPQVGLAAVRLAVRDVHARAHQPFWDPDRRFVLVYNGEIYNARNLRAQLAQKGWRFRTTGDTEVLLAAFAAWDTAALSRLNGMWAIAFFDRLSGKGFLARDSYGIKPLVYAQDQGPLRDFIFASEVGGLRCLTSEILDPDPVAAQRLLLQGYLRAPATFYRQARKLPPRHWIAFGRDGIGTPTPYPALGAPAAQPYVDGTGHPPQGAPRTHGGAPPFPAPSFEEAAALLRGRLRQAVCVRTVADVPIGAFLSGGLDSSIIVAHLAELSSRPVLTFSIGHAGKVAYDESAYARRVARHFGTDHTEIQLTDAEMAAETLRVLDHLPEPFGDSSIVVASLVSRVARSRVTVAMSGDGADELFAGYWRYLGHDALAAYRRLPFWVRTAMERMVQWAPSPSKSSRWGNRVRQFQKLLRAAGQDAFSRHLAWARILSDEGAEALGFTVQADVGNWPKPDLMPPLGAGETRDRFVDVINDILHYDFNTSLPDDMLYKVDLASMSHSLEVRVPFLDPEIVTFAQALPSNFKLCGGVRKRILLTAYADVLPQEILSRPKKGFELPIGEYLRGPLLGAFRESVTPATFGTLPWLRREGVERLLGEHLERRGEHADVLFTLMAIGRILAKSNTLSDVTSNEIADMPCEAVIRSPVTRSLAE